MRKVERFRDEKEAGREVKLLDRLPDWRTLMDLWNNPKTCYSALRVWGTRFEASNLAPNDVLWGPPNPCDV